MRMPWRWDHAGIFGPSGRSHRMRRPRRWVRMCRCTYVLVQRTRIILLTFRPWHGLTLTAVALPEWSSSDAWVEVWRAPEYIMKKKAVRTEMGEAVHLAPMESVLLAKHHGLIAHCATRRYDDGDPREPGWLMIRTSGSAWSVVVKDPDTCSSFVASAPTLDDALALATLLLESDEAPWERDQWLQAASKKRRK